MGSWGFGMEWELIGYSSFIFVAVTKYPDINQLRTEWISDYSPLLLRSQGRNLKQLITVKNRDVNIYILSTWLTFSTLESSSPNQRRVLPTFRLGLPTSINTRQSPIDTPAGQPDLDYTSWRLSTDDSRLCWLSNHHTGITPKLRGRAGSTFMPLDLHPSFMGNLSSAVWQHESLGAC